MEDLAPRIPYMEETGVNHDAESTFCVDSVASLPPYKSVSMCDGKLVQRLINYDFEKAQETTETWGYYEKEDMSDLQVVEEEVVKIPYTIDGTSFSDVAIVENYDPETLEADLVALEERQEELRNKSGNKEVDVNLDSTESGDTDGSDTGVSSDTTEGAESGDVATGDTEGSDVENNEKTDTMVKNEYQITANSALSEYLANSMLSGTEVIDVSYFPESSDQQFLVDAFQEAMYQNPLILGVKDVGLGYDGESLIVTYDSDAATMQKKQEEIVAEVKKIVSEIITDDMTELEKETAINQYLCDSAEYDMAALENAEENNFETVDEKFNDSFTPYGVLINKVGVCASYAGSFKLLADEAGLECIAVTGYLDGETPHEWNKVKIDGKWQIVDSTNNDNEELFNALFNLPDDAAENVLVEDEGFVLDSKIKEYSADSTDEEYYRTNQKYYEKDEIVNALVEELKTTGTSVLRTDYKINDDDFDEIAQQVLDQLGDEGLYGYYWMGVIFLTQEEMY